MAVILQLAYMREHANTKIVPSAPDDNTATNRVHGHSHEETREHAHGVVHGHSHLLLDLSTLRTRAGVTAVALSLSVLLVTSVAQFFVYRASGSVALLTDVVHNGGDALTAIPLGAAFILRSRRDERRSGYFVIVVMVISALLALQQVIDRFLHPSTPTHLGALFGAGAIGVIGNEIAAVIRWRAGRRLGSPALLADGNHARADGYVSAGIIVSAAFISWGLPIADPIIGLLITGLILRATWQSWTTIRRA
jgi:cation diffusion facilitator family transporter